MMWEFGREVVEGAVLEVFGAIAEREAVPAEDLRGLRRIDALSATDSSMSNASDSSSSEDQEEGWQLREGQARYLLAVRPCRPSRPRA
eukprot:811435-Rhodomonas_salina.2